MLHNIIFEVIFSASPTIFAVKLKHLIIMKPTFRLISAAVTALLLSLSYTTFSQPEKDIDPDGPGYAENCTSIMVGRLASTDGSVMTSHTCDGRYRTWLEVVPAMTFERDTVHSVYWGTLHTEAAWDMTNVTRKGEIPEVKSTLPSSAPVIPALMRSSWQSAKPPSTVDRNSSILTACFS